MILLICLGLLSCFGLVSTSTDILLIIFSMTFLSPWLFSFVYDVSLSLSKPFAFAYSVALWSRYTDCKLCNGNMSQDKERPRTKTMNKIKGTTKTKTKARTHTQNPTLRKEKNQGSRGFCRKETTRQFKDCVCASSALLDLTAP